MKKHSICPGCTLLCDDIEITRAESNIVASGACEKGQTYFQIETSSTQKHSVDGQVADKQKAIDAAARILREAKAPLVCGLQHFSTESQQLAWKIAERIGANVDSTLGNHSRASMFAMQRRGKVTATLGEIANRSDVVVFWFCDPVHSHPRLLERLQRTSFSKSARCRLIVIDEHESETSRLADQFIRLEREQAPGFLAALRGSLKGLSLPNSSSSVAQLATELSQAKYGAVFHGQVSVDSSFDFAADSLNSLVSELNDHTRFVGMKLRKDTNAQSAENVMAWSSGYPFAVNLAQGFPRFNGLEYSAETILTRGECDAVLFATGVDLKSTFANLSRTALDHLGSVPKVAFSPLQEFQSDVCFHVGVPGLTEAGEFCRNDDVSMPIRLDGSFTTETSTVVLLEELLGKCDSD